MSARGVLGGVGGGLAFPTKEVNDNGAFYEMHYGLTIRDYFAAKAMPFELTESDDYATVARRCFSVADAMLLARGVK